MKKTLVLFLITVLLLGCLSACKPGAEESKTGPTGESIITEESVEESEEEKTEYITSDQYDLRQAVVDYMKEMASIQWTAGMTLDYSDKGNANLKYEKGKTYLGMVYNNNQTGLEMFQSVLGAKNTYNFITDSWNEAPGNSCATSIRHAWQQVCANVEFSYSYDILPTFEKNGIVAVGDIDWSQYDGSNTLVSVFNQNEREVLFEAYALTQPGDALVRYIDTGGHAMMVTKETVVFRDKDGNIDPDNSYLYLSEQNNLLNTLREYPSSWKIDYPMTFTQVSSGSYLPVTAQELRDGRTEAPTFEVKNAPTAENLANGTMKGTVKCNYCINSLTLTVYSGDKAVQSAVDYPYARSVGFKTVKGLDLSALESGEYRLVIVAVIGFGSETLVDVTFSK